MNLGLITVLLVQSSSIVLAVSYLGNFFRNKKYLLFYLVSIIVTLILYKYIDIATTILLWGTLCLFTYLIRRNIYHSFFYPSLTLFIYIFTDNTAVYLYDVFGLKINSFLIGVLGTLYFWLITYYVKKLVLKKIIYDKERLIIATYVFSFTTIIYFTFICTERFSILIDCVHTANEIVMVVYGVMSTLIFFTLLFIKKKEFETREQQKEMNYLIEYSEQIEKNYTELLKFKHDYKNILISLEDYIQTDDIQGLKHYFYESIKATKTIFNENNLQLNSITNLKIKELKSIILSKLYVANQNGIEIKVMIPEKITKIDLSPIKLVRMLGIILDNAIEESILIKNPKIELIVLKQENSHTFVLINKCKPNIPKLHELKKTILQRKKAIKD